MEEINEVVDQDCLDLPPGFRFHPTDEELISHYLKPKVLDPFFSATAIGEVDLNKVEPWDLPWKAKMGEKEWYFFCVRDRKYPTGLRTNRATDSGYWKATGKDKEIFKAKSLVGMKKTLVFYKGRAPKGLKTNWVMHEYRLQGKYSIHNKNEWVICRVFHKRADGTKVSVSGLMIGSEINQIGPVGLPPLMDSCVYMKKGRGGGGEEEDSIDGGSSSHVTCFSDEKRLIKDDLGSSCLPPYSDPLFLQDNYSLMKMLLDGQETQFLDKSFTAHDPDSSISTDLDCFWNFSEMS